MQVKVFRTSGAGACYSRKNSDLADDPAAAATSGPSKDPVIEDPQKLVKGPLEIP